MAPPDHETTLPGAGAGLAHLLAETGLSQNELARRAGITQPNLSVILSGRKDPRASTVARILEALGRSWSDLDAVDTGATKTNPKST